MKWTQVWHAENFPLWVEGNDGTPRMHRVVIGGNRAGAVAIARNQNGEFALVRQQRLAIERDLWEFPRGMSEETDADGVATGLRELLEETGFYGENGESLGQIYPDSGILAGHVEVVSCTVPPQERQAIDGEVDALQWVSLAVLKETPFLLRLFPSGAFATIPECSFNGGHDFRVQDATCKLRSALCLKDFPIMRTAMLGRLL